MVFQRKPQWVSGSGIDSSATDIEKHPVDDNSLIFVFQSKLFNIQAEYDTEKVLRTVMFIDAHMKPYYWRWKTKIPPEYSLLSELPIENPPPIPNKFLGYVARRKKLRDKYYAMKINKFKIVDVEGKPTKIEVSPEQVDYELAIEWYRLLRQLFQECNILPRGYIDEDIDD